MQNIVFAGNNRKNLKIGKLCYCSTEQYGLLFCYRLCNGVFNRAEGNYSVIYILEELNVCGTLTLKLFAGQDLIHRICLALCDFVSSKLFLQEVAMTH